MQFFRLQIRRQSLNIKSNLQMMSKLSHGRWKHDLYDSLILFQQSEKWHQPLWGESHQSFAMNAISSEEDDEGKHLFLALLNWFKQVYQVFEQSTIYTQFLPITVRKELKESTSNYYRRWLLLLVRQLVFKGSKTRLFTMKSYCYKSLMTLEGRF